MEEKGEKMGEKGRVIPIRKKDLRGNACEKGKVVPIRKRDLKGGERGLYDFRSFLSLSSKLSLQPSLSSSESFNQLGKGT